MNGICFPITFLYERFDEFSLFIFPQYNLEKNEGNNSNNKKTKSIAAATMCIYVTVCCWSHCINFPMLRVHQFICCCSVCINNCLANINSSSSRTQKKTEKRNINVYFQLALSSLLSNNKIELSIKVHNNIEKAQLLFLSWVFP